MNQFKASLAKPYGNRNLSHSRKILFAVASLSVILFSIYGNSFDCSWHFDDEPNITDNPRLHMTQISWEQVERALFSDRNNPKALYRPIACLSFALNHYFGGLDVFGYHLVNVLIHLITSIFLFLFIFHTLHLPSLEGRYASGSYSIALLATLLWAIHPLHTQAVTYIVQRMALLAGMFYVMAMYFYLKARTRQKSVSKSFFFAMCVIAFAMAVGSKENAAILPLSLFVYEILLIQKILMHHFKKNLKWLILVFGVILLFAFPYTYNKGENLLHFLSGYENRPFTLGQRLLTEPRVIVSYLSLLFYPVPNRLSITHPFQASTSFLHPLSTLFSILFIFGVAGYAIFLAKKRPILSFCILFFILNHLIEATILPLELVFEHRNYIPSMLLFLPISVGFYNLMEIYLSRRLMRDVLSVFMVLLIIGLGHATYMRNFVWKNEKSLWTDAAEKAPDQFRPHHNLGRYYQDHGFQKEAIVEYQKALESQASNRNDEPFLTYYNLGKIYGELLDYQKAMHFYDKALAMNSSFPPLYNDMAAIFDREGKFELARNYLLKAITLYPDGAEANCNLGLAYLREGQPKKAIYYLTKVLDQRQLEATVLPYLGIAYKQGNQLGRAFVYFNRALKTNPKNILAHLHLAEILYRTGDQKRAEEEVGRLIELISSRVIFEKTLHELLRKNDRSKNLQPDAAILIPLMRKICLQKYEAFKYWSALLGAEADLKRIAKRQTNE
jgi:tetratricopeptide (TPR) repeat protein